MFSLTSSRSTDTVDDYRDYRPYVDPEPFSDINDTLSDWASRKADRAFTGIGLFARNAVILYELVRQKLTYTLYDRPDGPRRTLKRADGDCTHQSIVLASLAAAANNIHKIRFTYVENHVLVELGIAAEDREPPHKTMEGIREAYRVYFDREIGDLHYELAETTHGTVTAWFVADPTAERNGYVGDLDRLETSGDASSSASGWRWETLVGHRELSVRVSQYDLQN